MRPAAFAIACLLTPCLTAAEDDLAIAQYGNRLAITAPVGSTMPPTVAARLRQRVVCDFLDTPLDEVAEFIRRVSNLNVVCAPGVLAGDARLTLTARDMELGTVITWIRTLTKLDVVWSDGALFISDQPVRGRSVTRVYDVSDLVMNVPDFPGPELALTDKGRVEIAPISEDGRASPSAEDVAELIRRQIRR